MLAFVDYWPGLDPTEQVEVNSSTSETTAKDFLICNYNYIRKLTELQPYQIWLKLQDGATSEQLYADISAKNLKIQRIQDSSQMLIEEKTDPALQGMNGALTLGFVVIMLMTVIGFLIYWIISIRSRTLQFGVLRAMGVTFREVISTLGWEQLLVSLVSIAMGFVIGGIASDMFVPMFRTMYDAAVPRAGRSRRLYKDVRDNSDNADRRLCSAWRHNTQNKHQQGAETRRGLTIQAASFRFSLRPSRNHNSATRVPFYRATRAKPPCEARQLCT